MTASTTNTRWSLVQEAKGDTPQARAALQELCEIYYAPVQHQMRRSEAFAILKPWLAGDATHGDTRSAAERLNISETAVRVQVSRLRKRLRVILEHALADTLAPGANAQQELCDLMAALR